MIIFFYIVTSFIFFGVISLGDVVFNAVCRGSLCEMDAWRMLPFRGCGLVLWRICCFLNCVEGKE